MRVIVLLLLQLLIAVSVAAPLQLRDVPVEQSVQLPSDWRKTMDALAAIVADDEFRDGLRAFNHQHAKNGPVNYCLISAVTCNENLHIEALNLAGVVGTVDLSLLPMSTMAVTVANSHLRQNFDLTKLPFWVKSVKFENVTFVVEDTLATFQKIRTTLTTLSCRNCGLRSVDWESMPALTHLDLSQNVISDLPVASLPSTLIVLNVSHCGLVLTTESLEQLPKSCITVDLSHNKVAGSVPRGAKLPPSLELLSLSHNRLTGEVDVENLPKTLTTLDLSANNDIGGSLGDLSLFFAFKFLSVAHNRITSVNWQKLPPQLQTLDVSHNRIPGVLPWKTLPATIIHLDVSYNFLEGAIDVPALPSVLEYLDVGYNRLTGPVDFAQFSDAIRFIYLQRNRFSGQPDLTDLPVDVREALIFGNAWESLSPPR